VHIAIIIAHMAVIIGRVVQCYVEMP